MASSSPSPSPRQSATQDASVIVAGGGPVGMTLALDLAQRGVEVLVLEQSLATTDNPRCNTTNARSMEYYRRLGIADAIRRAGLPLTHPTDVVYVTNLLGWELARFPFSSSAAVLDRSAPEFAEWATPEPQHRVSQIYLEPIIEQAVMTEPHARVLRGQRVEQVSQTVSGVEVIAREVRPDGGLGTTRTYRASFVIGCDGGASVVRKSIGAALEGDPRVAEQRVSVYFRSPELHTLLGERPGWMYWWYGPKWRGSFVQLDGRELYLCHSRVPAGMDPQDVDPDEVLTAAIGKPVEHEKVQVVRWDPRRLVADHFRDRRVLLAGDAAHLWLPLGGFGMNTGIADAMGLSWRLAANLQGWGGTRLFDDYEQERRSVGEATSRAALKIDSDMTAIGRDPELHADTELGAELRHTAGELIELTDKKQWHSQGVQFGARYVDSPGIAGTDNAPGEAIKGIDVYEPSVAPGSRLPHYWRADDGSVFDLLGPAWTLLRVGPNPPRGDGLIAAADKYGVPLTVLDLPDDGAVATYGQSLVLCRPDLFVAWSGDAEPEEAPELVAGLLAKGPVMSLALVTLSHSPLMYVSEPASGARARVDAAFDTARRFIDDARPDLVVLFAPDHYNGFFYDMMPSFCIGRTATAIGDYGTPAGALSVDRSAAEAITSAVLDAGVDVALSERMYVDHGFAQPLQVLFGGIDRVPVVPIFMNCVAEPLGPVRRARLLGEAVGRAAAGLGHRVLVVGSGGLSHDPPVPRLDGAAADVAEQLIGGGRMLTPEQRAAREQRVIRAGEECAAGTFPGAPLNPDWDRELLRVLASGDLAPLDTWTVASFAARAGHSSHESRTSIAAYAALSTQGAYEVRSSFYEPIPDWIAGFAVTTASPIAQGVRT